jgi:hypothetical protein
MSPGLLLFVASVTTEFAVPNFDIKFKLLLLFFCFSICFLLALRILTIYLERQNQDKGQMDEQDQLMSKRLDG